MFWALIFLSNFIIQPVFAQDITPSVAPEQITLTPSVTLAPSETPAPSQILTPTQNPVFILYDQYKNDYLFQYDEYKKAYLNYKDKKEVYTKYGTLTTQQEKLDATKKAILARNKMLKAFLMALRVDLDKYKSINSTETEKLQIELSKWEAWFEEQNLVAGSFNNDDDVKKWVSEFKSKYVQIQQIIYTSMVQGEVNLRQSTLNQILSLAQEIKASPNIDPKGQEWFQSLPVKVDLINSSLKSAQETTKQKQSANRFTEFYSDSKRYLNKSVSYLLQMESDLKSIVIKFSQP